MILALRSTGPRPLYLRVRPHAETMPATPQFLGLGSTVKTLKMLEKFYGFICWNR
jgi:hypothetical protein